MLTEQEMVEQKASQLVLDAAEKAKSLISTAAIEAAQLVAEAAESAHKIIDIGVVKVLNVIIDRKSMESIEANLNKISQTIDEIYYDTGLLIKKSDIQEPRPL